MAEAAEVNYLETPEDFKKAIEENAKVVVDFTAAWCPPCKKIAPVFKKLQLEYPDIKFYKVDVDENGETAADEGISAMPTFKFFLNGKPHSTMTGAAEGALKEKLAELNSK